MTTPVEQIKKYVRAANYLVVTQIHLQNNYLLERKLEFSDIKPRLIGHWGTCPGINFVWANLNYLIKKTQANIMFILGPGHGFAAIQSDLFIDGTLSKYYPLAVPTLDGIGYISKNFSWPYGFQSHCNPTTPGVILEGGELGYSLATAYGTVLDNPDLITVCLVGDGEAETGSLATAWHLNKYVNPATSGVVLPILHLNGYKISGPTVFGRMTVGELNSLFYGYGYHPYLVEGEDEVIYDKMLDALDMCYQEIRTIKLRAEKKGEMVTPRYPMIILRTKKGWTGIKELHGQKIEDNCLSHQVVVPHAKTDHVELEALNDWLDSYHFGELFDKEKGFCEDIKSLVPPQNLRIGENKNAYGSQVRQNLSLPDIKSCIEEVPVAGGYGSSSMRRIGQYLTSVFELNREQRNFRLFSPDETYSNKLDEVFKTTSRPFVWPIMEWDKDLSSDGRVMEMLSEHSLIGMMQGYILSGRHGIFASYEAFVQIVSSMIDQYAKFLKISTQTPWRGQVSSFNIILTSSGWRQEHNGFSHQNPGVIGDLLEKQGDLVNVYFPPDGNTTLVCLRHSLESTNRINVIVCGKTFEPRYLSAEEAEYLYSHGLMEWKFASDGNPDFVLVGIGDYMVKEILAAIDYIKSKAPNIKLRCVDVLQVRALVPNSPFNASLENFDELLTPDKPVIFNFHGNPETLKPYLLEHKDPGRFLVHGYIENGSITTPFDMQVRNKTSRYHLAKEVFEVSRKRNILDEGRARQLIAECNKKLDEHRFYIIQYGVDPPEIEEWQWVKPVR